MTGFASGRGIGLGADSVEDTDVPRTREDLDIEQEEQDETEDSQDGGHFGQSVLPCAGRSHVDIGM